MLSTPIYQLRPQEALQALETSPEGISSGEALARQALYGKNVLVVEPVPPLWRRLSSHSRHPFSLLLLAAGAVALLSGEWVVALLVWTLVTVNVGLSFWREHRAEQAIQALQRLLPAEARILRDGQEQRLPAAELVPGDVLVLAEGDYVPADGRVLEANGLRANHATLAGESTPVLKTADASFQEGLSELDRPNLVFAGTTIAAGNGQVLVYATGARTQFGRMARLTQSALEEPSTLQLELLRLTRLITWIAFGLSGLVFLIGWFEFGLHRREAFLLSLGILAAAVPEGLPATLTLSLAAAGQRLAQKGVLVRRLAAVETLGAISVLCTDKSGTLTQNQMTVRRLWVSGRNLSLSGVGYDPRGQLLPDPAGPAHPDDLDLLLKAASLCNNSRLNQPTRAHPTWNCLGDQTEAALRVAGFKAGLDEQLAARMMPRVHELPFDARRKRMSTIHRCIDATSDAQPASAWHFGFPPGQERREVAFVKGAPREVLELCTRARLGGAVVPLEPDLRSQILAANDVYARQALRVLALAYRELPPRSGSYSVDKVERELTFLGLMAMHDPPRPEASQTIQSMRQAGIRILMITGDYGLTAATLAQRVGILDQPPERIVTGSVLEQMPDQDLTALLEKEVVFARMAPEHKLKVVAALQARGEVVGVLGDGVNDAPALRKADIGIAMGLTGTDVAKEAADIVLTGDNIADLVQGVVAGRAVYDNLRKFMNYIFASNVPQLLPVLLTALINLPLALTVRQILAIDLGTDLLPGLALGVEPPEPGLMQRPPRRRTQPLLDRGLLQRIFFWMGPLEALLAFSGFFWVYGLFGDAPVPALQELKESLLAKGWLEQPESVPLLAATMYHAGVVTAQMGNAFASRTATQRGRALGWFSNPALWLAVLAEGILILALIYVPPLARIFSHTPLPLLAWGWLALYGPALYLFDWLRKQAVRKLQQGRPDRPAKAMEVK